MKKEADNNRYNLYFFGDSNYIFSRIFFKSLISIKAKNIELKAVYDNCKKNTDSFYFYLKIKIKLILYFIFNKDGKLLLTNPDQNLKVIKDCNVLNLKTNKICKIEELI